MAMVKLYASAIVVGGWALLRATTGLHGGWSTTIALTALCAAIVVSELERSRRRGDNAPRD